MNGKLELSPVEGGVKKPRAVRRWLLLVVLGMGVFITWLAWPSAPATSVVTLSRIDGKPRFQATRYPRADLSRLTLKQRLCYMWEDYRRRHGTPNLVVYSFPAQPVHPCSIQGLLNQCMEISGTKYLIAVEVLGGTVDFGHTNTLNGSQWIKAFEHALTNQSVRCRDFGTPDMHTFKDKLVLIRERPDLVKVVPRSKLSKYQAAGLVRAERVKDSDE